MPTILSQPMPALTTSALLPQPLCAASPGTARTCPASHKHQEAAFGQEIVIMAGGAGVDGRRDRRAAGGGRWHPLPTAVSYNTDTNSITDTCNNVPLDSSDANSVWDGGADHSGWTFALPHLFYLTQRRPLPYV